MWQLPKDRQFPLIAKYFPEAAKFSSLWAMKDAERVRESKVLWILMDMSINMAINSKPRLSPRFLED